MMHYLKTTRYVQSHTKFATSKWSTNKWAVFPRSGSSPLPAYQWTHPQGRLELVGQNSLLVATSQFLELERTFYRNI